ncbi:SET domain-containing protein [Suillus paluster]|uniref:SET domain-containing protein n=1 Tax=Suillus paluster TaxID=48578 RepID=UPI001B867DE6|nr:SET domain-containing protein [Suillus paluster]KAG1756670.1 SET domain-containing protein [Suillus paluster]
MSQKPAQASTSVGLPKTPQSDVKGDIIFVRPMKPLRGRARLQSNWNQAAKEAGAESVRISDEITDAEIGQQLHKFKYMERKYHFENLGLQTIFDVDTGAFLACVCKKCDRASQCDCQTESEITNERGHKLFAYSGGLFAFRAPQGAEVIECNKLCRCSLTCGNRVAQKPRDVPIEIFKTKQCGWGARCRVALPRGKVLGIYTGTLVRREDVDNLPPEHIGYVFDLDGTEIRGQHNPGDKFSVDSYDYGNWTRFVNHSCAPNMKVYCVVFDTIREVNMPYVAFVASRDIPAGEELNIDYEPSAAEEIAAGTTKQKQKMSPTALLCRCGAEQCRGWIKQ